MALPEETKKHNNLWYLCPILLSWLGGIIGFFYWKNQNKPFAQRLLVVGVVLAFVYLVILITIGSNYNEIDDNANIKQTEKINIDNSIKEPLKKEQTQSDVISKKGFSGLTCKKNSMGWVQLTGKYTNGDKPYSFLMMTLGIIGEQGEVLDTGIGIISNIGAHQTKIFTASSTYSGNFKNCHIQIDSGY